MHVIYLYQRWAILAGQRQIITTFSIDRWPEHLKQFVYGLVTEPVAYELTTKPFSFSAHELRGGRYECVAMQAYLFGGQPWVETQHVRPHAHWHVIWPRAKRVRHG
ncbi:MAG: hypothetical protein IPO08_23735 [Xanthomonadales bacterium]|nr:hypothetical protein [Xanthomonadales bacterium]